MGLLGKSIRKFLYSFVGFQIKLFAPKIQRRLTRMDLKYYAFPRTSPLLLKKIFGNKALVGAENLSLLMEISHVSVKVYPNLKLLKRLSGFH